MHQIYVSHACALLLSTSLHTGEHAHLSHQWTLSLTGAPFGLSVAGQWLQVRQIFIPSQQPHQFADQEGQFLTLLLDADCTLQYQTELQQLLQQHVGLAGAVNLPAFVLALQALRQVPDARIRQTMHFLTHSDLAQDGSAAALAAAAGLSPSRFLHLFKQQTGVPLRKYILWQKLRRVLQGLAQPEPPAFTELALAAGFYDAAHLANYIRTTFGLSLRDIVQNSRFFQELPAGNTL